MRRERRHDGKVDWLATQPWFAEVPRAELRHLAADGDRMDVPAGRELMHEGVLGREMAFVVRGEVAVVHDGEVLAVHGPGALVGERSLVEHAPRNASVTTSTDVELLVVGLEGYRDLVATCPTLTARVERTAAAHA